MTIIIAHARSNLDIEAVHILFRQYAEVLPFDLAYQGFEAELAALPAQYSPPDGCLLLAKRGSEPVGAVGLKRLGDGIAEIKRLYVVPEERRCGIGKILLRRIIEQAQALGYNRVRLDSHRPSMSAAIGLYRDLGFGEIPPYGPDLEARWSFS